MYRLTVEHYTPNYADRRVTVKYADIVADASALVAKYEEHPRTISVLVESGDDTHGWRELARHDGFHS